MMNKILFFPLLFIILISCTQETLDEPEYFLDYTLSAHSALDLRLSWETNHNENKTLSLIEADLELELHNGEQKIAVSSQSDQFEHLNINRDFKDGKYKLVVNYFSGIEDVQFNLHSSTQPGLNLSGAFSGQEEGKSRVVATLYKNGSRISIKPFSRI